MATQKAKNGLFAGILIIGDEILKGHVQDTNSYFLCRQLWELGVRVEKITVVGDGLDSIAEEVKAMADHYDFVFTTGGIGPTHDDVTMEAVGRAFGEGVTLNPDILKAMCIDLETGHNIGWKKSALVPTSTIVYNRADRNGEFTCPLMVVHNVHCYPGVPSLVRHIFSRCKDLYSSSSTRFSLRELFLSCDEDVLADKLSSVQDEYPSVQIGSYPNVSRDSYHVVKISFESESKELVEKAFIRLFFALPIGVMMSAKDNFSLSDPNLKKSKQAISWLLEELPTGRSSLLSGRLCESLHQSVCVLEKLLEQYSFSEVCVAFNGGKDCTVILHLLHSILKKRGHDFSSKKLKVLFVDHKAFEETEAFVKESCARYDLEVIRIKGSIREALSELKSTHSELKAICMGTRSTDPHSDKLEAFSQTDPSWPQYMRVHCILDWSYSEVWQFLKLFSVPYCSLYDRGYTSLDGVVDTRPNPALLVGPGGGDYLPACMLCDEALERAGRTCKPNL